MAVRILVTIPATGAIAQSETIYMGQHKPPFTVYIGGAFAGSILVLSSPNAFRGAVPITSPAPDFFQEFGEVAPTGETTSLSGLTTGAIFSIKHPVAALVFLSFAGLTGAPAQISVEMDH